MGQILALMNKRISLLTRTLLLLLPLNLVTAEADFPSLGEGNQPQRFPGKIIWHDLFTSMPGEMAAFYGTLFGWESEARDLNGNQVFLMWSGGYPVAAIVERAKVEGDTDGGIWIGYASTGSAEAVASLVTAAGGRILVETGTFPGRGEHAIFRDDQGAIFGVLNSETGDPGEYLPNVGDFFWSQHLSLNVDAAAAFYGSVSRYELVEDDRFEDSRLFILSSGGFARAGLSPLAGDTPAEKADWIHFIRVDSVEQTIARLAGTGARVLLAPSGEILDGRLAILSDPSGALVGIMEAADDAAGEEGK